VILPDINLLIHAYNTSSPVHARARQWWEERMMDTTPILLPWVVVLGFVRLSTHRQIAAHPLPVAAACALVEFWLARPQVSILQSGEQHLSIFLIFCALWDQAPPDNREPLAGVYSLRLIAPRATPPHRPETKSRRIWTMRTESAPAVREKRKRPKKQITRSGKTLRFNARSIKAPFLYHRSNSDPCSRGSGVRSRWRAGSGRDLATRIALPEEDDRLRLWRSHPL
jgi:predicted nucleic acid-binding protein